MFKTYKGRMLKPLHIKQFLNSINQHNSHNINLLVLFKVLNKRESLIVS